MWCGCHVGGSVNAGNGGCLVGTAVGVSASASPPGLQRWEDLLCTGEGAGSMYSRVIVAVMGHAVS